MLKEGNVQAYIVITTDYLILSFLPSHQVDYLVLVFSSRVET